MRTRMVRRDSAVVALLVVALLASACAGTIRDQVRKGALIAGETALTVDQLERDLYTSGVVPGYTAQKHAEAGKAIIVMLTAVRAYERAARAWPETMPTLPRTVWEAQADALAAIAAVDRILEDVPKTERIHKVLGDVRVKIGGK